MKKYSTILTNNLVKGALVASTLLLVVSCGKESTEKKATQVAAIVNDSEITVHQINYALQSSGVANSAEAPKKILEGLIDQELFVQKAVSNHLDREPNVMMALENGRRQILSQSYIQQVLDKTPIDIKAKREYYEQNPDLFSKRRVYQFQLFNLEAAKLDETLNTELEKVSNSQQVKELLNRYKLKFQEESVAKSAEQLPFGILATLAKAKTGDVLILPQSGDKILLMQIANMAERPVTFEQAQVQIEQFLTNSRNKKTLETHLEQLHKAAKISYEGDFVNKEQTTPPPTPEILPSTDTKSELNKQKILESGFK